MVKPFPKVTQPYNMHPNVVIIIIGRHFISYQNHNDILRTITNLSSSLVQHLQALRWIVNSSCISFPLSAHLANNFSSLGFLSNIISPRRPPLTESLLQTFCHSHWKNQCSPFLTAVQLLITNQTPKSPRGELLDSSKCPLGSAVQNAP